MMRLLISHKKPFPSHQSRIFSSSSSSSSKPTNQTVNEVTTIILNNKNWAHILNTSPNLLKNINPNVIQLVLHQNQKQTDPNHLLHFFNWSVNQMGISNLTLKSFLILFTVLVNSSDLRLASGVLGKMIDTRYPVRDIMDEIEVFCVENEGLRLKFRALLYGMVVDCYRNKGLLDEGVCVLLGVKCRDDFPDLSCVNVLVTSLVRSRKKDLVFKVFEKMGELKIVPDVYMYTNLIGGLCKDGDVSGAKRVFVEMGENGCDPSLVTYNVLIGGLCKSGLIDEAFEVKRSMVEKGLVPDRYTYTMFIDGLCKMKRLEEAKSVLEDMLKVGVLPDHVAYSALIDLVYLEYRSCHIVMAGIYFYIQRGHKVNKKTDENALLISHKMNGSYGKRSSEKRKSNEKSEKYSWPHISNKEKKFKWRCIYFCRCI